MSIIKHISFLLCLLVFSVFMFISIFPFGRKFPIGHLGNTINAVILSYAVVGHQLVDIRFVLRRGLVWLSIGIIGLACYWALLLGFHALLNIELTVGSMFAASVSGIISVIIIYKLRGYRFTIYG